jgi:hypothetical protein
MNRFETVIWPGKYGAIAYFYIMAVIVDSNCLYSCEEHRLNTGYPHYLPTLQRTNTENSKQISPEMELLGHSPNFHIHVSVSDLYIPTIDLPILLQDICGPIMV